MLFGILLGSFLFGSFAFAQLQTGIEYGTATGLGSQDIRMSIMQVVRAALGFLGVLAIIVLMYGGWVWMTAAGNADRIALAKRILINAVVGLTIIFSSFMIASFIIRALSDATGAAGCTPLTISADGCSECNAGGTWVYTPSLPSCVPGGFVNECRVVNITPHGVTERPINTVVRVKFNRTNIINANTIEVYNITGAPVLVPTTFTVTGNLVEIIPITGCPAPAPPAMRCFDANSTFEVQSDDLSMACGGFDLACTLAGECVDTFVTGDELDLAPPTVMIISDQICEGFDNRLRAQVNDDFGLAFVDFFENGSIAGSDNFLSVPPSEIASIPWDITAYAVGDIVQVDATAVDYDSNITNAIPLDFETNRHQIF